MVRREGLQQKIGVDSCGTGSWHIGEPPDERACRAAEAYGYALQHLRARKLEAEDFQRFHYLIAMDTRNLADIIRQAPPSFSGQVRLLLDYLPNSKTLEVPDPYYGDEQGFDRVFTLVESACRHLLADLKQKHD
jgi:protein-tyrosine phosphatase